jgi:predicted ABC-type ATPase
MTQSPPGGPEWDFDAQHCESHLAGAAEHAGKLAVHLTDNYPAEARWLTGPSDTAQLAGTISGQVLDLIGDGHGRHIPGTPMVYRHGWKPITGGPAKPALASQGRFGTVDSLHAHTGPGGALTPQRLALHDRIVSEALAGHAPQLTPVATFMGGGPASGKSHLPGPAGPEDSVHIDPDQIKELLPEYNEMQAQGEGTAAAAYTHEESSALSKRIEAEAIGNRMNLTLDGVGNSSAENMTRRIAAAKAAGYRVRSRYVTIDTEEALRRNRTRLAETARWVPEVVIRDKHAKVSRVFPHLIGHGLLDEAELWDNNVPKGSQPVLIGSKPAAGQWQVHDPAAYQRFLDKAGDAPRLFGVFAGDLHDCARRGGGDFFPHPGEQCPVLRRVWHRGGEVLAGCCRPEHRHHRVTAHVAPPALSARLLTPPVPARPTARG